MPKKIPLRRCCGCRSMKPKQELIRVVKTPDGNIELDFKGKTAGRGAYICKSADCFSKAVKSGGIANTLGAPIPQEIYNLLESEF